MLALAIALLVAAFVVAATGCQKTPSHSTPGPVSGGTTNPPSGSSGGQAYEVVTDLKTLPLPLQRSVEIITHVRGVAFFKESSPSEFYTVVVGFGLRGTDGYSVAVKSVETVGHVTKVTVEEKAPIGAANDVITNPHLIFRQARQIEQIEVKDTKGNAFPLMAVGSGAYNGRIDANSVEIETTRGPQAFRLTEELKSSTLFEGMGKKQPLEFCYFKNSTGQDTLSFVTKAK